jgi:glycosyltransferase involved in cell wall biosynthesis
MRIMRIVGPMDAAGPAAQVGTLMRELDPDLFEQRLYLGAAGPIVDDQVPNVDSLTFANLRPLPALRALTAAMREFRPDVVHTHTATAGTVGRMAAVLARVPVRVHTFDLSRAASLAVRAERALARRTHRLLAVSQRVRDDLVAARIGRQRQYELVSPGVALPPPPPRAEARQALGLPGTAPIVAVVGQVTQAMRPDRMLAVAREVRQRLGDVRFIVCGDGDLLPQTVSGAYGLGVTFLPPRPDVETVYAAADVVLQTSDREELPVSLIEAALCERPVVATDAVGVSEVVRHGETGLVTPMNVPSLTDAVIRLLRDDTLRRWMGRQAAAAANRRFGTARLVDDVAELYLRLANRQPIPEPALR